MTTPLSSRIHQITSNIESFARSGSGLTLRPYQAEIASAVADSVLRNLGRTFVVILPRQSGKNETAAQVQAYLLALYSHRDLEIVSVSPTFKPQTVNAMDRLVRALDRNPLTRGRWKRHAGYTLQLGRAAIHFFSGTPLAHTVGATASLLLNIDEAQDILKSTYDRKFAPMVASSNATRLFWGTAWTSTTLLAREKRLAEIQQNTDGIQRLWLLTADDIQAVNPPYGQFVQAEIDRLGRDHPFIRTQFFSQEMDAQLGMFNPTRLALIQSDVIATVGARHVSPISISPDHSPNSMAPSSSPPGQSPNSMAPSSPSPVQSPIPGLPCAFLLDIAGQDESRMHPGPDDDAPLRNPGRDAVSLSITSIDLSTLETLRAPTYRIIHRQQWLGQNHLLVFGQLKSLIESWKPQYIVIDATGVGEGLFALLDKAFPRRVIEVRFGGNQKSELGWRFISIIETGRFRDCAPSDAVRLQYVYCRSEVLPGPAHLLRWGVPENTRGPDGELIHDDYLLADALVAKLDTLPWVLPMKTHILPPPPDSSINWEGHF